MHPFVMRVGRLPSGGDVRTPADGFGPTSLTTNSRCARLLPNQAFRSDATGLVPAFCAVRSDSVQRTRRSFDLKPMQFPCLRSLGARLLAAWAVLIACLLPARLAAIDVGPIPAIDTKLTNIVITNIVVTNVVFWITPSPVPASPGINPRLVFLEVGRAPGDASSCSVRAVSVDGTASAGIDFIPLNQVVAFGPGAVSQLVVLEIPPNSRTDGVPRSFTVELRDPLNALVGIPSTVTIELPPPPLQADLSLSVATDSPTVPVGEILTLNAVVMNSGPAPAPAVAASIPIPAGFTLESAISAPRRTSYQPATGRWEVGLLNPGESLSLQIRARAVLPIQITVPMEIIQSGAPDPDSTPANGAPAEDDIAFVSFKADEELADLQVTLAAKPQTTNVTEKITVTVTLENLGPKNAKDILLDAVLPAGLTLDSHKAAPGSAYTPATGVWSVPALNNGAKTTLELVVKAQRGGWFTNVANIRSSKPRDPVAANNRAEVALFFVGYSACGVARVCNNVTNLPNPNATIVLDGPLKLSGRADALGAFCFTNLLPGKYKITITPADPASGIDTWSDTVDVGPAGDPIDATALWLAIVGRVTLGSNGPPVAGLTVEAVNGAEKKSAVTDANGEYKIVPLGKKSYDVTVLNLPAGLTSKPAKATIDTTAQFDSCPPRADFILTGKLSISGLVRACNARGALLASATVTLTGKGLTVSQQVRTGPDGRYSFPNLPPGKYTVSISHPTHTFTPRQVDITLDKESVTRNFIGDPTQSLGGRIVMGNGQPFPGVEVVLLEAQQGRPPVRRTTTTDSRGEFLFAGLPAGLFEIIPTPPETVFTFTPPSVRFVLGGPAGNCGNFFTFRANRNAAEIVAIEAVQVIQDWQNNVPLVQDKATLIRAFLKPAGTNRTPVVVNNARLRVERDGRLIGLYGSEAGGLTARSDYATRRNMPETSIPFVLPAAALKGTNTLTLEWPVGSLTTSTAPGQTAVRNNRTEIRFRPMPEIPIRWVLVNWTFGGVTKNATDALASSHRSRLLSGMPTASLPSIATGKRSFDWKPAKDPTDAANDANLELSSSLLRSLIRLKRDDLFDDRLDVIYHGILDGTDLRGAGDVSGGKASFADPSAKPQIRKNLAIHEVGHALGRHHAVHSAFGIQVVQGRQLKKGLCDEVAEIVAPDYPMDSLGSDLLAPVLGPMRLGEYRYAYGWDSASRLYISPFSTPDVMSYCTTFGRDFKTYWGWPGVFTYTGMMDAVRARFARPVAPRGLGIAAPAGTPIPVVRVSGMLDGDGRLMEFDPVTLRDEEWVAAPAGELFLQLRDASGNLLAEQSFDANPIAPDLHGSDSKYYREFYVTAPWIEGTANIEIHRAGLLVGRQPVSANAPVVSWNLPTGEAPVPMVELGISLAWQASDVDGDRLVARIEASDDGGASWNTLALDLPDAGFVLRPDHFSRGGISRVRVVVSDGFHSTASILPAPILVPDRAPTLRILRPGAGSKIDSRSPIHLGAESADAEDGVLTTILWNSDRVGNLGNTAELDLEPGVLALGLHRLTASVTDSTGKTTTETVEVEIVAPAEPGLTLTAFADRIELRWPAGSADRLIESAYALSEEGWFPVEMEGELEGDEMVLRLPIEESEDRFYRIAR